MLSQQNEFTNGFKTYVFGSVLSGGSLWADVDILLVALTPEDCERLNQALEPLAATVPLHVTTLLEAEFAELGPCAWGARYELIFS